jgi:hypothetical protein
MPKGKASSRGHEHNPKGSNKPKGGTRPNRPHRSTGSKVDVGEILKDIGIIIGQVSGNKAGGAEPKPGQKSGGEPAKSSQTELQTFVDLIEKELAKEKPDKELIAVLLKKIKEDATSSEDGETGRTATLDDLIKKLRGTK